jgi:Ni,Fe-hydrogenase maturation factor
LVRPKRLVLGLGNPLVGEDGFGGAVIEWLRRRPDLSAGVDLVDAHTDLLAQVETLASYDEVVLVDVVVSVPGRPTPGDAGRAKSDEGSGRPGTVTVIDEEAFARCPDTSPSCHQISPLLAVNLFRALHPEAATRITLVALHADGLRFGPGVADSLVTSGGEAVIRLIT